MAKYERITSPIKIGSIEVRNRLVFARQTS